LNAEGSSALGPAAASNSRRPECHLPVESLRSFVTWLERRKHGSHRRIIAPFGRTKHHLYACITASIKSVAWRFDVFDVYSQQESLADAKVSVRQQCVYEGCQQRNLEQINDIRFPIDG